MEIKSINIDVAKWVFLIVAVVLAISELVSWWTVVLFILYSIEFKASFDIR